MNLIDRYVYTVAEYLPKDIREDVIKELRANIEDMLPENYSEEDVYKVLEELGSPMKLAGEYNPQKRYLIGPGYFDKYISVLKMVVGICIVVSVTIAIINYFVDPSETTIAGNLTELFAGLISGAFVGAVQGAFWVTLIFVILERSGAEAGHLPFFNEKWTPASLPEAPVSDHSRISRGETVFSMICTIIFTALMYFQPQLLAIYRVDENKAIFPTPLFDLDRLKVYMVFIFALAILQLGDFVWKYITQRWNMPIVVCNAIYNVLICILAVVMIRDDALFNPAFVPAIADLTKGSVTTIAIWFDRGKRIFTGFFILFCVWDSISAFFKCRKKHL